VAGLGKGMYGRPREALALVEECLEGIPRTVFLANGVWRSLHVHFVVIVVACGARVAVFQLFAVSVLALLLARGCQFPVARQ
jgi:hypothetical protein